MARSNASAHQTGQQGQANWQAEVDAYGRPIDANGHRGAMSPPAPRAPSNHANGAGLPGDPHAGYGYQGQQGYPPPGYGQPVDQSGYHQPEYATAPPHASHDPYAHQGQPSQGHYQQPYPATHSQAGPPAGHYPQGAAHPVTPGHFERFNPQAPAPAGYDRYDAQLSHEPPAHDAHAYDQRRYEQAAAGNPAGYGQPHYTPHDPGLASPAAHLQPGHQQSDPRSWDFGQYPPIGHAHQPGYDLDPHAGQHEPRFADPGFQAQGWNMPAQPSHYAPHQQLPYPAHGYEPAGAQHGQYGMQAGDPALGYEQPHGSPEAGVEEEDEEPRRGPRPMIVAAALVCAIAVGGGLAFGYKKLVADGSKSATPIVKADRSPVREKPRDPGGKEQPHTDKKFPNRLDEKAAPPPVVVAPQAPPAAPAETEGGPRRVTTVIINKDGTITPSVPPAPAGPPPGMVVENVPRPELRGPAQPERVVAPPAAPPVVPVQKAPPAQPKVADLPLPKVRPEPRAEAPQPQTPPPARKKPAVRDDLLAQQPAVGAPPATKSSAGGTGFVAVLVSRKSREDALKSFADLHQKYPDILQGRAPDVREKDFGDAPSGPKGVWYRLIVGPPGSKEASQELCQKLAAQGFKGCFSMVY